MGESEFSVAAAEDQSLDSLMSSPITSSARTILPVWPSSGSMYPGPELPDTCITTQQNFPGTAVERAAAPF